MYIEDDKLIIDEKVNFESYDDIVNMLEKVDEVSIQESDIHPSIFQLLFCVSKVKKIAIEDPLNKRLFENIKFLEE